ncbi:hypothetical protein EUX98_g880 [Antrodiella citrinella]|uniref:DUF6534 domain-containing protein n=1 Tax=Antrodiella citrinella TaxID=2447956 RepID=A0A4S4N5X6_9APHY|nr:hypothetical protein EUX98_g880 [Antrodiella citrinella]
MAPLPDSEHITVYVFAAALTTTGLYAITCMQTFLYFIHYHQHDSQFVRFLVVTLWAMDSAHFVLTVRAVWRSIIDPVFAQSLSIEALIAGLFTTFMTVIVQLFFAWRIYKFVRDIVHGRWRWLLFAFVPCSLYQLGGYIAFIVLAINAPHDAAGVAAIRKLPQSFWGVGAAEDIIISLILLFFVWQWRLQDQEWTSRSTMKIINRLTFITVNTGLWTAACALAVIISLAVRPDVNLYVALYFIQGTLYCNTFLANLNTRGFICGDLGETTGLSTVQATGISFNRPTIASDQPSVPTTSGVTSSLDDEGAVNVRWLPISGVGATSTLNRSNSSSLAKKEEKESQDEKEIQA